MDFAALLREEKRAMRAEVAKEVVVTNKKPQDRVLPKRMQPHTTASNNNIRHTLIAPVVNSTVWEVEQLCVREWEVRDSEGQAARDAPLRLLEDPMGTMSGGNGKPVA